MQRLFYVKTLSGMELYCDMCDTLFKQDFVNNNINTFQDIHRSIHKKLNLDTPDLDENPSYTQSKIELWLRLVLSYPQITRTYPHSYPHIDITDDNGYQQWLVWIFGIG
jgi:hypothetical protein